MSRLENNNCVKVQLPIQKFANKIASEINKILPQLSTEYVANNKRVEIIISLGRESIYHYLSANLVCGAPKLQEICPLFIEKALICKAETFGRHKVSVSECAEALRTYPEYSIQEEYKLYQDLYVLLKNKVKFKEHRVNVDFVIKKTQLVIKILQSARSQEMKQVNKEKASKQINQYSQKIEIPLDEIFDGALESYKNNVLDKKAVQDVLVKDTQILFDPISLLHKEVCKRLDPYTAFFRVKSTFHNMNNIDSHGELIINLEIDPEKQDAFSNHLEMLENAAKAVGMTLSKTNF